MEEIESETDNKSELTFFTKIGDSSWLRWCMLLVFLVILIIFAAKYLPAGIDWHDTFRPAGIAVLRGDSPYAIEGFRIAPWSILAVLPFAWMPESIGRAFFLVVSLLAFAFVPYRLGAKPFTMVAFLISPPVLHCLLNANIDWLPMLGFTFPPRIGLFFLVIKPQIGIGLAIYWFLETLIFRGWRDMVSIFAPVVAALITSFLIFGFWPERYLDPVGFWWNASLWPASIPVGLVLLTTAVRQRKKEFAFASSPCLSPYVLLHSWSGALVALSRAQAEMISAVIGLWILVAIRGFSLNP